MFKTAEDYYMTQARIDAAGEVIAKDIWDKTGRQASFTDDMGVNRENCGIAIDNEEFWGAMCSVAESTFGARCEDYGYDINNYGFNY